MEFVELLWRHPEGGTGATGKPPEKPLGAMNKALALRSEWLYLTPQPPSLQREGGATNSNLSREHFCKTGFLVKNRYLPREKRFANRAVIP